MYEAPGYFYQDEYFEISAQWVGTWPAYSRRPPKCLVPVPMLVLFWLDLVRYGAPAVNLDGQ